MKVSNSLKDMNIEKGNTSNFAKVKSYEMLIVSSNKDNQKLEELINGLSPP
jgi:hypothetical protein